MRGRPDTDPLPLSPGQVRAVLAAARRELSWALPEMSREARRWESRADQIPAGPLRDDARRTLERKRGNIAGAMAFSILPQQRSPALLRALFAHQVLADYLDDAHERHTTVANGLTLHHAVRDALTPGRPLADVDYYAHHPWSEDGGYLAALVEHCRRSCAALPSIGVVEPLLWQTGENARYSLCLGNLRDPVERDPELRRLAAAADTSGDWRWFELTAAMAGQLQFFILLALAAKPGLEARELEQIYGAYWPGIPLLATMLDSFADQAEDGANGNHPYVTHYGHEAVDRLADVIENTARRLIQLPEGQRHAVILGCMVAFYMTKDSARSAALKPKSRRLLSAGGSLSLALAPVLRLWRHAYGQAAN